MHLPAINLLSKNKRALILISFGCFIHGSLLAQWAFHPASVPKTVLHQPISSGGNEKAHSYSSATENHGSQNRQRTFQGAKARLWQRNYGMIAGIQRGKYTFLELGGEIHWRKISLFNPRLYAATANAEYNFGHNVIGYKAGLWMKRGRINLTYGLNASYITDFTNHQFGGGPAIGFRLLGFHLVNGYNFLTKSKSETVSHPNKLYVSLRYYFPLDNKFNWIKSNQDTDDDREKAKVKKRKQKQKAKRKRTKEKDKKKKRREKERRRRDQE